MLGLKLFVDANNTVPDDVPAQHKHKHHRRTMMWPCYNNYLITT